MPKNQPAPIAQPFTPAETRPRHDGWTPARQTGFVEALAESGCVGEACAAVGMSRHSAYRLRMRVDAQGFRMAWDAALDLAIRRLSDECYSRALNGEAIPHFFQGQQVGEHRRYDNRLAMFLLRYRDPLRYAATLDQMVYSGHAEQAALAFARARDRVADAAHGVEDDADAPAPAAAFRAVPVADELARQRERALVEGDAPIHGTHERRWRLKELRAQHYAAKTRAGG